MKDTEKLFNAAVPILAAIIIADKDNEKDTSTKVSNAVDAVLKLEREIQERYPLPKSVPNGEDDDELGI